ncbi:Zinc finger protein STOP1-like protein [Hibiscus syriacus]|uniref:Zinc finger protein STOP1-like protein n=1 Tax=Hibiscus syriacus TaxID=106335 RepID=A0A6A3BFA8_HIBSY|nr:zinc finger protein STOP1 homolog [Hibiscus syriacus]KAE8715790.1 Zinc finger protein STOP1-like protein [Hibiscus syriacus]
MSSFGEPLRISPDYSTGFDHSYMQQVPVSYAGPRLPLLNLSTVKRRMDPLQHFLALSLSTNTLISNEQMELMSSEIASAIHQIIVNGAALLSCAKNTHPPNPNSTPKPKSDSYSYNGGESDIIELDAVELLSEHLHLCEICGKGFKRDANLRMHMRAHGEQYKTPEALAKKRPNGSEINNSGRETRFSCPYSGCNKNKTHEKFRPLKSIFCVRNHFKRSHCPKTYGCKKCHKKRFSVLADLKSHLKHCVGGGEEESKKWMCSCGNSFCRKDKLFRHLSLFEGHMPAVAAEEGDRKLQGAAAMEEKKEEGCLRDGLFDGLLDGFGSLENYCLQDLLGP